MDNVKLALSLLRDEPKYQEDARRFAGVGNSVVGSLLSIVYKIPRQYAEPAVRRAMQIIDGATEEAD